eukprot:Awhi_evm14s12155
MTKPNTNLNFDSVDINFNNFNLNNFTNNKDRVQVNTHSELEESYNIVFPKKGPADGDILKYDDTDKALVWDINNSIGPAGPAGLDGRGYLTSSTENIDLSIIQTAITNGYTQVINCDPNDLLGYSVNNHILITNGYGTSIREDVNSVKTNRIEYVPYYIDNPYGYQFLSPPLIVNLEGQRGLDGADYSLNIGPQGEQGVQGEQGIQGENGLDGLDGADVRYYSFTNEELIPVTFIPISFTIEPGLHWVPGQYLFMSNPVPDDPTNLLDIQNFNGPVLSYDILT